MTAIVYMSNTGYTAEYAHLLGKRSALPVYALDEAKKTIVGDADVIYLGWLMASTVKGYRQAAKRWNIVAVGGVCLGTSGSQIEQVRKTNRLPAQLPVFTLQGGFDMAHLHGMNKFMMKIMRKILVKQITAKDEQTEDDKKILDMLQNGGSAVDERHLELMINNLPLEQ